ncbi:MAG: hypothetical protein ACJA04_000586, partial [Cellvibrionaceae bacterium]
MFDESATKFRGFAAISLFILRLVIAMKLLSIKNDQNQSSLTPSIPSNDVYCR